MTTLAPRSAFPRQPLEMSQQLLEQYRGEIQFHCFRMLGHSTTPRACGEMPDSSVG